MTKAPTATENPKTSNVPTQKRHQNFEYTTIADRLTTVSRSYDIHQTGEIKLVNGIQNFQLTTTVV